MAPAPIQRIGLVGFGEVGGIFGRDFAEQGIGVSVYDILFHSPEPRAAMFRKARDCGVEVRESLAECLRRQGACNLRSDRLFLARCG